ncbi:MAG: BTAD domain-containing putative transcriptional regulator [Cyanobacteria bacterium P01_A01_bin.135]
MPAPSPFSGLRIHLLGKYHLSINGTPITNLQSERLQALLAFLLLHRNAPQPRSQIAARLWPEVSDASAKANLRRRLHDLKQHLPEGDRWLKVASKTVGWVIAEGCELDVAQFEALSERHALGDADLEDLEQAAQLYRGDLLPDCYDDWIVSHRERLRQQAIALLDSLINRLIAPEQASPESLSLALTYAQQLLQIDPLYEPAYRHLMQMHVQKGDRATALRVYHQCMTLLQEELGVPPSPSTAALYTELLTLEDTLPAPERAILEALTSEDSITGHPAPDNEAPSAPAPRLDWGEGPDISLFRGRSAEIAQIRRWVLEDRSRVVALLGMGGIGKTALAAKVTQALSQDFDHVIWRSLRNAPPLTTLLNDLVPFLSNQQDSVCSVARLMYWLRQSRCLVVLDNCETVLKGGAQAGQFREGYDGYGDLIRVIGQSNHQSCLLLTSREKPAEISVFEGIDLTVRSLQIQGSPEVALAVLEARQLTGTAVQKAQLSERYGYSPLALQIVGGSIRDVFSGDISLFLEEDTLLFNGAKKLLDQQFARLSPLEKTVMYWLAINRDWTHISELMVDVYPRCGKRKLLETLESLRWRGLIETVSPTMTAQQGNAYNQQPVVMEYVTSCLIEAVSGELADPSGFDEPLEENLTALPYLSAYALVKATGKDFVRATQRRLIAEPILENLANYDPAPPALAMRVRALLPKLRRQAIHQAGYAGGNLLNLCCQAQLDVTGFDFSRLTLRQADLQGAILHKLDVSGTEFVHSAFTQSFGSALSIAYSPDGKLLAMGENNYNIRLWRTTDGQPLMTLQGHENWVWSIAFSPDGKTLVSGGVDYTVRLWEVASGQCLHVLQGHSSVVWGVAFGPDGQTVASGSEDQTAKVWDVNTGACLQTLESSGQLVRSLVFHPNGKELATAHADAAVRWWNLETGDCLQVWRGHQAPIWAIALHPDGQQLASAGADQTIRLWDVATGECSNTLVGHTNEIWSLAFSPDGQRLASGSHDRTVRLWDLQTETCLATMLGHTDQIWSVGFSPDGQRLASGGFDQTIRLWDVASHQCVQTLQGYTNCIRALVFCDDGATLVSGGDDALVRRWNLHSGECLQTLEGHRSGIWTVAHQPSQAAQAERSRPLLATAGFDQTIRLWAADTGQLLQTLDGRTGWVNSVAFHPNGKLLASSSIQPAVCLWDLTTGECLQTLSEQTEQVWTLAFSPDGRCLASAGADHRVKIWDIPSGKCLQTLEGHTDYLYSIAFGPRQAAAIIPELSEVWLASASADRTIKLWNLDSGECFRTLTGHEGWVYAMVIHPHGDRVISASYDCTARVWDIRTGKCLQVFRHDALMWSLAIHPQGHLIACSGEEEKITLWNIDSGEKQATFPILKPYAGMWITDVTGLTDAQKSALKALGAVE